MSVNGVYWMRWKQDIAVLILPRAILMRRKWEKRLKSQGSIRKKYGPSTPEAIEVYLSNGILYGPAKASNAGGVATSGLEMSQNSERLSWSFEEVDAKLKGIMEGIFHASYDASVAAGSEGNLMVGANCAGFLKVATAMMAQGITY